MNIVADASDARAHLDLPLTFPASLSGEFAPEAFARGERARGLVTACNPSTAVHNQGGTHASWRAKRRFEALREGRRSIQADSFRHRSRCDQRPCIRLHEEIPARSEERTSELQS